MRADAAEDDDELDGEADELEDGRDDGDGRATRREAAARLGVSVRSVQRLEQSGELTPERDENGVVRFDPAEVEELVRRRARSAPGAQLAGHGEARSSGSGSAVRPVRPPAEDPADAGAAAARAFELIDMGLDARELVIAMKITPSEAERHVRDHARLLSLVVMDSETSARLVAEYGRAPSGAEIVALIGRAGRAIAERKAFSYRCAACGEGHVASPSEWSALVREGALDHITRKFGCPRSWG